MEGVDDFAELGEDEDTFLAVGEFDAEFGEAGEFSAIGGSIDAVAAPVAGVIADLFEPHEVADDEAAALVSGTRSTAIPAGGSIKYRQIVFLADKIKSATAGVPGW